MPTRDSTPRAEISAIGDSKERPAAMNVERRMRCEEGEYDAAVTPERFVLRQKVVGRTLELECQIRILNRSGGERYVTKWWWWAKEFPAFGCRSTGESVAGG